jgi:hypothetical protein
MAVTEGTAISTSTGTAMVARAAAGVMGIGDGAKMGAAAAVGGAAVDGERLSQTPSITARATRAATVNARFKTFMVCLSSR